MTLLSKQTAAVRQNTVYCVSTASLFHFWASTDTSDRRHLDQCDIRKGDSLQGKKRHTSKTFGLESTEHAVIFLLAQKHLTRRSQSSRTMCGTGSLFSKRWTSTRPARCLYLRMCFTQHPPSGRVREVSPYLWDSCPRLRRIAADLCSCYGAAEWPWRTYGSNVTRITEGFQEKAWIAQSVTGNRSHVQSLGFNSAGTE